MSKPKVMFYVQHLLGIGHVKRAATLARSMVSKGLEVTLISGGPPVPVLDNSNIRFVQLPSLKAIDRGFESLVDVYGNPVGEDLKEKRKEKLLNMYRDIKPNVLMIELYPFGRRQLEFELIPLLEQAKNDRFRPHIVCSVRDILVEKNKPQRDKEMVEKVKKYFDDVLVHGDPSFISFDETFKEAKHIRDKLHYTGYVVDSELIENDKGATGIDEIVVSSGSGAVGEKLLRMAIKARSLTSVATRTWRILVGYGMSNAIFESLKVEQGNGLIIERARSDFIGILKNSFLSISQGGYNTLMEILATNTNGIAVPYAGGNETEQTLRTKLLEERGLIRRISEENLTVSNLVRMIDEAVLKPLNSDLLVNMGGDLETARMVQQWATVNMKKI